MNYVSVFLNLITVIITIINLVLFIRDFFAVTLAMIVSRMC